jgi:hypothetical protein
MNKSLRISIITLVLIIALGMAGCGVQEGNVSEKSHLFELTELRESVATGINFQIKQSAVYYNGQILIGTTSGIWSYELESGNWNQTAFDEFMIPALYQRLDMPERMYAAILKMDERDTETIHFSTNGGVTWEPAAELPIHEETGHFPAFSYFAARPGYSDHLYAVINNNYGWDIASTADGGLTWLKAHIDVGDKYHEHRVISFLPDDDSKLLMASTNLDTDQSYIGVLEIDENDAHLLSNYEVVLEKQNLGRKKVTYSTYTNVLGHNIYMGHRGALSAITLPIGASRYIYIHDESEHFVPEIHAIWVNSENPDHLLFGGSVPQTMNNIFLYETFDNGETVFEFNDLMGMSNPQIVDIIQTDLFPVVIINDMARQSIRLFRYAPAAN